VRRGSDSAVEKGNQKERDYSWVYQVKDSFKVLHSIPRDKGTGVPTNTGIEITFSHDNFSDFEKYFTIQPKIAGRFEKHGRTAVFVPAQDLQQGTIYKVSIDQHLPIIDSGETLGQAYTFEFETQLPSPYQGQYFRVYKKFYEVSSSQTPVVQVYANHLPKNEVDITVYHYCTWQDYSNAMQQRDRLPW